MIETLNQAPNAGVKIATCCASGLWEGFKSIRRCTASMRLDLETLIWTRGAELPTSTLSDRLNCMHWGSRKVVLFDLPGKPRAKRA